MVPRCSILLLLFVCMAALGGSVQAQSGKSITIRFLDSRTGNLITPTGFLIRVDHQQADHADWVQQNEDGSGKLTLQQDSIAPDGECHLRQDHVDLCKLRFHQGQACPG